MISNAPAPQHNKKTIAAGQNLEERKYWLNQLAGFPGPVFFPYDSPPNQNQIPKTGTVEKKLPPELASHIKKLSKDSPHRIHMILCTGLLLLLHKYTCQNDITIGIPTYKQKTDGPLINTALAIRQSIDTAVSFKEFLIQVSKTVFDADKHQNYPITTLPYQLNLQNDPPNNQTPFPLFDTAVLLDSVHDPEYLKEIQPNIIFNFSLKSFFKLTVTYNPTLYTQTTIKKITRHYQQLLENALNNLTNLNTPLSQITILSQNEIKQLLFDFNNTHKEIPPDQTVPQTIENQAVRHPNRIALQYKSQQFSLSFINQKANELSKTLKTKGLRPSSINPIIMTRSPKMLFHILATWKTKAAYLPIDPSYPEKRKKTILKDAFGDQRALSEETALWKPAKTFVKGNDGQSPFWYQVPFLIAYVIYTSGSTGKPKGAVVEHIGMLNHMLAKVEDLQLDERCIIAQNATHTFDISVWQFFTALMVGGKTVIYPDEWVLEPRLFIDKVINDRITVLEVVPSYLAMLLDIMDELPPHSINFSLDFLMVTGEEVKKTLVEKWFRRFPRVKMANAYGPTEASDDITHLIMDQPPQSPTIPIGKTVRNFCIVVVNKNMELCPIGVKGEILVSGPGVGRGYLNNPTLTNEKFIPKDVIQLSADLLEKIPGTTWYRTGDLGAWRQDGTLDFFGRIDFQVKIRGFRIELGEIENRISSYPNIKETVVIVNPPGTLCAYFVPTGDRDLPAADIKKHLENHLPNYMIPSHFIQLKKMPLTPSGKIDRNALPDPASQTNRSLPFIPQSIIDSIPPHTNEIKNDTTGEIDNYIDNELDNEIDDEAVTIIHTLNGPDIPYPKEKSLHRLFEEQTARTPGYTAVVDCMNPNSGQQYHITYDTLNTQSGRLARQLKYSGVNTGSIVALIADNSLEYIIGMWATLKAGAAWLPIPADCPETRIRFILADANPSAILTTQPTFFDYYQGPVFLISNFPFPTHHSVPNNLIEIESHHPACIFYTSGSTGQPKGTAAEHRHVHNAILGLYETVYKQYNHQKNLHYALLIPGYFDGCLKQILAALFHGNTLYIASEPDRQNLENLPQFFTQYAIQITDGSPTHIRILSENPKQTAKLTHLKHILSAGDVLLKKDLKDLFDCLRRPKPFLKKGFWTPKNFLLEKIESHTLKVTNLYGITECCIDSTAIEITPDNIDNRDEIPIGTPLPNQQIHITNTNELYITGDNITRGYINRPLLTEGFYLATDLHRLPAQTFTDKKYFFKTGDNVLLLPDGYLRFVGRIDNQIQVMGVRVEPGEVEGCLKECDGVERAVVVGRDGHMCGFVVLSRDIAGAEVLEYLKERLPGYMVPARFVQLEKIPLTANGKIRRKLLETIDIPGPAREGYEPPANATENRVVALWQEVLSAKKELIGVNDNFFDLGGHSLSAVILLSKIHKAFDVKITLTQLFESPTVRELARVIETERDESDGVSFRFIQPVEKREYYPLSSQQRRLYFIHQLDHNGTAYNLPQVVPLAPGFEADPGRIENTFRQLIARHESLRTFFQVVDGEPVQRVTEIDSHNSGALFALTFIDAQEDGNATVEEFLRDFVRPFDLSCAPLVRAGLIRLPQSRYLLVIDMHHIISDAFSHRILTREFLQLYRGVSLPPQELQYRDFSMWQQGADQEENRAKQERFWLERFRDFQPLPQLPLDFPRPPVQDFNGGIRSFSIEPVLNRQLKELAAREDVTLFMVVLAVFNIFLSKITGARDMVVGTPVSGRRHADLHQIIGMMVNTLALRNSHSEEDFVDFLAGVKQGALEAFDNQDYPFDDLVEKTSVPRDAGRHPVFDVMLSFQGSDERPGEPELENIPGDSPSQFDQAGNRGSKFDLTLLVVDQGDSISWGMEYCTGLFKRETIGRFIDFFKRIIGTVCREPGIAISQIEIISPEEKKRVLEEFNDTAVDYPFDKTIHGVFSEQVEKTPDRLCLVGPSVPGGETVQLTYGQLENDALEFSKSLKESGTQPGDIVAIVSALSAQTITEVLAILMAEAAYLPINPENPQERIAYILKDTNAKLPERPKGYKKFCGAFTKSDPPEGCQRHEAAYVMYTSGTTGRPKGVVVPHCAVLRLVKNIDFVPLRVGYRLLGTGAFEFDASTFEIWGSLLNGLTFYITSKETVVSPPLLRETISRELIDMMWMTSPLFNRVVQADVGVFFGLSYLIVGGDVVSPVYVSRVRECFPGLTIINGYGPTENTTFSTTYAIAGDTPAPIPIGKPIANSTAVILNKDGQLQPVGIPGELWVGGDGIATGYLNNPELTVERFFGGDLHGFLGGDLHGFFRHGLHGLTRTYTDKEFFYDKKSPCKSVQSVVSVSNFFSFYKSGDLARWLSDGNIEFLGRDDGQVKVGGYRVEVGEVSSRLLEFRGVGEAVVVVRRDGDGEVFLCGYVVADDGIDFGELREFLRGVLPVYMVPSCFVLVEEIPLTFNGKIDYAALPLPGDDGIGGVGPLNDVEADIIKVWAELLPGRNVEAIGRGDNFFDIGGNSLKAMQAVTRLSEDYVVTIHDFFRFPTPGELAPCLKRKKDHLLNKLKQIEATMLRGDNKNVMKSALEEDPGFSRALAEMEKEEREYRERVAREEFSCLDGVKDYGHILLTGATGFLGAYLAYELIERTGARLYVVVRGETEIAARERLERKLAFYFGESFVKDNLSKRTERLVVLRGDLTGNRLGFEPGVYEELSRTVEAVVHSAANVKHYGDYKEFYRDNVEVTRNLLDFALAGSEAGRSMDFHHISTMSVGRGYIEGKPAAFFSEYCHDVGQRFRNVYTRSKFEAEKEILNARSKGLNANIYRVGNLTADYRTGMFQENIGDNAFYSILKSNIALGMVIESGGSEVDMAYIDCSARALVLLMTRASFSNETFHIENIGSYEPGEMTEVLKTRGIEMERVSMETFFLRLPQYLDDSVKRKIIEPLLFHSGLLDGGGPGFVSRIGSERTVKILEQLGFKWPEVTREYLEKMIDHCRERGFIE